MPCCSNVIWYCAHARFTIPLQFLFRKLPLAMPSKSSIKWNPALVDEDSSAGVVVTTAIMTALITISWTTRISMKLWSTKKLLIEDYLSIFGFAANLAGNILEFVSVHHGFGRHLQFLTAEQETSLRLYSQIATLLLCLAMWFVNLSICFFILSLIRGAHQRSRYVVYGLIAVSCIARGSYVVSWATQAQPLEKMWHPKVPGTVRSKKDYIRTMIAATCVLSVIDLFYALAPIYFFGSLQMDRRKKIIVLGLTGTGLFVFATSIVRLAFVNDFFDPDFSWALSTVFICGIIERNLSQFVADLPISYQLIRKIHNKMDTMITQRSGGPTTGSAPTSNRAFSTLTTKLQKRINSTKTRDSALSGHGLTVDDGNRHSSADDILLDDQANKPSQDGEGDKGITVRLSFDVESRTARSDTSQWPNESVRS